MTRCLQKCVRETAVDKTLCLSSSGKLLTRCLFCRTYQSLYYTNGTAPRLALRSLPEVPSTIESQMVTRVIACRRPRIGSFSCQSPSPPPLSSFLQPHPRWLHRTQTQSSEPLPLDLIVHLRFPSPDAKCQKKKQKSPFLLAWGENLRLYHLLISCPSESCFCCAATQPNSHSAAQDSAQCRGPK